LKPMLRHRMRLLDERAHREAEHEPARRCCANALVRVMSAAPQPSKDRGGGLACPRRGHDEVREHWLSSEPDLVRKRPFALPRRRTKECFERAHRLKTVSSGNQQVKRATSAFC